MTVERWTHALRRPGPASDRCTERVQDESECGCADPIAGPRIVAEDQYCSVCLHELVPAQSLRPVTDSPTASR